MVNVLVVWCVCLSLLLLSSCSFFGLERLLKEVGEWLRRSMYRFNSLEINPTNRTNATLVVAVVVVVVVVVPVCPVCPSVLF